ncbi:transport protein Avl9-domain-containing protein [Hyaloraphidium curvatum]|nr:transport protein Avl9-domain-containing protein [Hyaloraphidium curvatum]
MDGPSCLPDERIVTNILLVNFHHRAGPQVEFCHPPLPPLKDHPEAAGKEQLGTPESLSRLPLPPEWSDLPFFCLPDGAHLKEEEFTSFHLAPVAEWPAFSASTTFGMACCRQIKASELVNKTADVTRNTVQKAVVVLAREPVYGAIRSILGSGTQAFFNQRDFSQTDILKQLYVSLNQKVPSRPSNEVLYQATKLGEVVRTFRAKTLTLFKLLLLERRLLFFGSDVETLCNVQYSLVSLIPELMSHLKDVGSPQLEIDDQTDVSGDAEASLARKLHMPLRIFQKGAYFQPYCPLQKMSVLFDPNTRTFVAGVTNQIFVERAEREDSGIHAVIDVESGSVEILDRQLEQTVALTAPDKRFIEEIAAAVDARFDFLGGSLEQCVGYLSNCCHTRLACGIYEPCGLRRFRRGNPGPLRTVPVRAAALQPSAAEELGRQRQGQGAGIPLGVWRALC